MKKFQILWLWLFPKQANTDEYKNYDDYRKHSQLVLKNVLIFLDAYGGLIKELFSLSPAHLELREISLDELIWEMGQPNQSGELARHYHIRLKEVENWKQSWLNRPWREKAADIYLELGRVLDRWKREDNELNSQDELGESDFVKIIQARGRLFASYEQAQPFIHETIHQQNN